MTQKEPNKRRSTRRNDPARKSEPTPVSEPRGTSRTMERRKEREQEERRQRNLTLAAIGITFVILIGVLFIIVSQPAEAPLPEGAAARYADLPAGRTSPANYPRLGASDAPVQVALYSSFDCTACKTLHDEIMDPLAARVRDGQIALVFVPQYGTGNVSNGQGAANAAICVALQNPSAFWPFHDALFNWQSLYGNQAFTNNRIVTGVSALNLDRGAFDGCVRGGASDEIISRARNEAEALLNFNGTPTVAINGVVPVNEENAPVQDGAGILAAIDRAIGGTVAGDEATPEAETTSEPTAEPTPEATTEAAATLEADATAEPTADATAEVTPEATDPGE